MDLDIKKILNYFPLRISITDYCNLNCFFCSNEGMDLTKKNTSHISISNFKNLINILADEGLQNVSLTGGDPTLHPNILELVEYLGIFNFKELFFHTNGIGLNEKLIQLLLDNFSKIAVSIHSVNFDTWKKITNGNIAQFNRLMDNIKLLAHYAKEKNVLIEIKYVPVLEFNASKMEIEDFLNFCSNYGFKFKFLNFEPITKEQIKHAMKINELNDLLRDIGCVEKSINSKFRGQSKYIPYRKFSYKDAWGVSIEIGCGDEDVCKECYNTNEIFINPDLKIKPCHANEYEIDIKNFVENGDKEKIKNALVESRIFLCKSPGLGLKNWNNKN